MFADHVIASLTEPNAVETLLQGPVPALEVLTRAIGDTGDVDLTAVTAVALRKILFAVPVFETVLTEETTVQQASPAGAVQARGRRSHGGRLVWADAIVALQLTADAVPQGGPVTGVHAESLFERLGDQPDLAALEAALAALVPPAQAAATLARLGITSIADYRTGRHRVVDVSAGIPGGPSSERFEADLVILVFDGTGVRDHLRSAALTRAILVRESRLDPAASGRRPGVGVAFLVILADAEISANPFPGRTPDETQALIRSLFRAAGFLVHFAPEPGA